MNMNFHRVKLPMYKPRYINFDKFKEFQDSFFTIATLLLSYDTYLWNEARKLIEKSESAMLPNGQLPHHFVGETPTYVAISGIPESFT